METPIGKRKIQELALQKANSFPEKVPIYYYGGHGSDVCDPSTHKPVLARVPDDCIYITVAECGDVSYLNLSIIDLFTDPSEEARKLLRYPYLFQNLLEISKNSRIPLQKFHIHLPGSSYVVSNFEPFSFFDTPHSISIAASGLCEKELMEMNKEIHNYTSIMKRDLGFQTIKGKLKKPQILDIMKKKINPEQKILREIVDSSYPEELMNQMFPDKEELNAAEITGFFENVIYVFSKDTILNKFSASVFPTMESVRVAMNTYFHGINYFNYKNIQNLSKLVMQDLNGYPVNLYRNSGLVNSNKNMMKDFPGIHYNLICRVVSPECLSQATLRRKDSLNRETLRRNILLSRRPEEAFYYNSAKLENSESLDELMGFVEKHKDRLPGISFQEKKEFIYKLDKYRSIEPVQILRILEILFPYKESYTPSEARTAYIENIGSVSVLFLMIQRQNEFVKIKEERLKGYVDRIDVDFVKSMTDDQKTIQKNLFLRMADGIPKESSIYKKINEIFSSESDDLVVKAIEAKIQEIFQRSYPKARNAADLLRTKQIAIYNYLLGIKGRITSLNELQSRTLMGFLETNGVLVSDSLIEKKIKYLIRPTEYQNPLGRGGTRRLQKRRSNRTMRQRVKE